MKEICLFLAWQYDELMTTMTMMTTPTNYSCSLTDTTTPFDIQIDLFGEMILIPPLVPQWMNYDLEINPAIDLPQPSRLIVCLGD